MNLDDLSQEQKAIIYTVCTAQELVRKGLIELTMKPTQEAIAIFEEMTTVGYKPTDDQIRESVLALGIRTTKKGRLTSLMVNQNHTEN